MLILWRVLFVAALAFTAYATLSPLVAPAAIGRHDKLIHGLVFAIDTLLGLAAFGEPRRRRALMIGLIAFGAVIECLQGWVPHRKPSVEDAIANTLGILLAALIWRSASSILHRSTPSPREREDSSTPGPRPPTPGP